MIKSKIAKPESGLGLFAAKTISEQDVLEFYYAYMVHVHLTNNLHKTKMYREGVTHLTARKSQKWTNELPGKVSNKERVEHEVQIVPVRFFDMWCTNIARYIFEDATLDIERIVKPREVNVQFAEKRSPSSHKRFTGHRFF